MLEKCHSVALLSFLIIASFLCRAEPPSTALSLGLVPDIQIPLGASADLYTLGAANELYLQYDLGQPSGLFLRSTLDYGLSPYLGGNSLSLFAFSGGLGYTFSFSPRFRLDAYAGFGYNYGFKNSDPSKSGGSLFATGGAGVDLILSPSFGLTLGASFKSYTGLLSSAGAFLGATYFLSGSDFRAGQIKAALPIDPELLKGFKVAPPGKGLSIESLSLSSIFPVFRKYYDDHPAGTILVRNNEGRPIRDVSVSLFVKDYMDQPKKTQAGPIAAGASLSLPVFGLFNDTILSVTESTKVAAELVVEYRMDDADYRAVKVESLRVLDRNAMTWDDDRRAAAFVTAKDPAVLGFAKNVSGYVRDLGIPGVDRVLVAGAAIHEALSLYGLAYVVDPKSSYAEQSKSDTAPDFLQFPRQTLSYRAGDCDDISILTSALLESIGIETAFVTVPGHIFIAFNLGMTASEAKKLFSRPDNLVLREDGAWVPVEITDISKGFLHAWELGAREWREASAAKTAAFIPLHEAWKTYESVGLPGAGGEVPPPPRDKTVEAVLREMSSFAESEISALRAGIETSLKTGLDERVGGNRLGILYARFGRYDQATAEFRRVLAKGDYSPALVNLGNVSLLLGDYKGALAYFQRGDRLTPEKPSILISAARAAYALGDTTTAAEYYTKAAALDPSLASAFAYLSGGPASTSTRSADAAAENKTMLWEGL